MMYIKKRIPSQDSLRFSTWLMLGSLFQSSQDERFAWVTFFDTTFPLFYGRYNWSKVNIRDDDGIRRMMIRTLIIKSDSCMSITRGVSNGSRHPIITPDTIWINTTHDYPLLSSECNNNRPDHDTKVPQTLNRAKQSWISPLLSSTGYQTWEYSIETIRISIECMHHMPITSDRHDVVINNWLRASNTNLYGVVYVVERVTTAYGTKLTSISQHQLILKQ